MPEINVTSAKEGEVIQIGPSQIRVLEDGSRTDDRIGAVEITLAPNTEGPPQHFHVMHDETFLVTSGTVRFIMGDKQHDAGPGEYVVVPTGAAHTFANPTDTPAVFFNTFTPAYYVEYFRQLGKLVAGGPMTPEQGTSIRERYATVNC